MHLIHDLGHPRVDFLPFKWGGGVGGGCGQVAKGSSQVGVELPPWLLAPPVDVAAPEAREASCLTLNVARQLGKIIHDVPVVGIGCREGHSDLE